MVRLVLAGTIAGLQGAARAETGPGAGPDFGPQVLVFDSVMPMAEIQTNLDGVFQRQERSQFGTGRYAFLFKPGTYDVDVNVGFYTQVLGLGRMPGDTRIRGAVHSEADWMRGNATCTFWRACENLAVEVASKAPMNWAVSQGTSFRRMHVSGDLNLWDGGWSSGGFMADSRIDGQVNSGSQQQWFSRNDRWERWTGANWNMVFVGVENPPAGKWPDPPYTTIDDTPRIREKPYLYVEGDGSYAVWAPAYRTNATRGPSWATGPTPGESVPLARFYLARPERDQAATINAALEDGRHLLFTPGIYHLEAPIRVTRPRTIVLGLGLATLIPVNGTPAVLIDDVPGVRLASVMIDAGPKDSPVLMRVGTPGGESNHPEDPICLYDAFFRVGGAAVGRAHTCLEIDASHVLADNLWIWRADHGAGANWNQNPSRHGLVVNGHDVTIYGLFVEHFQDYQTVWRGERGRVYFYQCELPYDAPSQEVWQHDGVNGYAAYKVADGVQSHEAWALGVYGVFTRSSTRCFNAYETPSHPGVKLRHLVSIWITGRPGTEITHVINGTGAAANAAHKKTTIE